VGAYEGPTAALYVGSILTLSQDGGVWSASRLGCFAPREGTRYPLKCMSCWLRSRYRPYFEREKFLLVTEFKLLII